MKIDTSQVDLTTSEPVIIPKTVIDDAENMLSTDTMTEQPQN